jgi:SAM-dependent methyltransferase
MPTLPLLYRRILHALDNHGLRGLVRPPPAPTPGAAYAPDTPHPFDLEHNVDTSGHIPGEALATGSTSDLYNTAYWAISPSTLRQAFAALPFDPAEYTFVDLGCGKGRALLLAAQQGFGRILGVELSPQLAVIARANTAPYPAIEVRTQNAAQITLPDGPVLVFLYHPFLPPLLRRVLKNLLAQQDSRPLYILFANPLSPRLLKRLTPVWTRDFDLSPEDRAADRHGLLFERYTLYQAVLKN